MSLIDNKVMVDDTIKVRRGNVILRVPAEQKDYYKGLGYNVISDSGEVLEETVPTDVRTLQRLFKEHKQTIEQLECKITDLEDTIADLQSEMKAKSKATTTSKRKAKGE